MNLESFGFNEQNLTDKQNLPSLKTVSKGLVYCLYMFAKKNSKTPVKEVSSYLSEITGTDINSIPLSSLQSKLYRLVSDKKSKGGKQVKLFFGEIFNIPCENELRPLEKESPKTSQTIEKLSSCITELKKERKAFKRKIKTCVKKEELSKKMKLKLKTAEERLSKANAESMRLKKYSKTYKETEDKTTSVKLTEKKTETQEQLLEMTKSENSRLSNLLLEKERKIAELVSEKNNVMITNNELIKKNDYLMNLIDENEPLQIFDEETNQFKPELINCVMELQNCNISVANIPKAIRAVSSLCGRTPNHVPSASTINRINDMRVSVALKQMEDISMSENLTLYTDETSKFGKSFEVFAITDENKESYLLGLREMFCKSSHTVLDTLKEILSDISNICTKEENNKGVGLKLLIHIKNTMSDRAATEKKFQSLLEIYRTQILSRVEDDWEKLSQNKKTVCSQMNNFFLISPSSCKFCRCMCRMS